MVKEVFVDTLLWVEYNIGSEMENETRTSQESVREKAAQPFFPLTITGKILLGFLLLSVFVVVISWYAISNLERLNRITQSILTRDAEVIDTTEKLLDSILAHELYTRRYGILKSEDMITLYWERSREFELMLDKIAALPGSSELPIDRLRTLYAGYKKLSAQYLQNPDSGSAPRYQEELKKTQDEIIVMLKAVSAEARRAQNEKMVLTANISAEAFKVSWILCVSGITLGAFAVFWITRNISVPIQQLKHATKEIAEGKFDYTSAIQNRDELGDLSHAFSEMTTRLKRLETMYLDASPLTRLPGGVAIDTILRKRIADGTPLVFCLIDMDNFKAFSDHYGYAKGSEVIKAVAKIVESAVSEQGAEDDFVGHIGGDDFAVITVPERYKAIASAVIGRFDRTIPDFYAQEDRERGYIVAKSRQGQEMHYPVMTISVAVVTNQHHALIDPLQVGEIAAELKEYAKSIPESIYVVDNRRAEGAQGVPDANVIPFPQKSTKAAGE